MSEDQIGLPTDLPAEVEDWIWELTPEKASQAAGALINWSHLDGPRLDGLRLKMIKAFVAALGRERAAVWACDLAEYLTGGDGGGDGGTPGVLPAAA